MEPATTTYGVTNEGAVGLPPLTSARKDTWDLYRIEFLPDGYPGRRSKVGLHAHPIYGPYVIADYLAQHRTSRDPAFLEAAQRVADAAIARMDDHEGAAVFHYQPGQGISSMPSTFYSGLTQARYLSVFGKLATVLGSRRYAAAAEAILRSLELPVERGGVARRTPAGGLLIEEYSHQVPDYTLNGWTTATTLVHDYVAATGDEHARSLFEASVRGLADVLPLYDVPELANSRYRLTGPATVSLRFSRRGVSVRNGRVEIPGQGSYPFGERAGKWTNGFVSAVPEGSPLADGEVSMQVQLCRVSWPVPNRVVLAAHAPDGGEVTATIGEGAYHPLRVQMDVERERPIGSFPLRPGTNVLEIAVPWSAAELVAYPTNFAKSLGGRQYNSYHFIHVDTLSRLATITGDPMLTYYSERWAQYPARWPELPQYQSQDIVLDRYRRPDAPGPRAGAAPGQDGSS